MNSMTGGGGGGRKRPNDWPKPKSRKIGPLRQRKLEKGFFSVSSGTALSMTRCVEAVAKNSKKRGRTESLDRR